MSWPRASSPSSASTPTRGSAPLYSAGCGRRVKGRAYLYVQLVLRGQPCPRRHTSAGLVGAHLGPSMIGVVTDSAAAFERFCDELQPQWRRLRQLQRRLDRQHRAGSPACFDERGRHRPGRCVWSALAAGPDHRGGAGRGAPTQRRAPAKPARQPDQPHPLYGTDIRIERLSYRAWQRGHYSRAVRDRAPGMFVSELRRKAASAGGSVVEFDTGTTALSQVCVCGRRERKSLELRTHRCPCGITAQRDLFSALLARHVHPGTQALDARAAAAELSMRHDIAARTASSNRQNRRLGWRSATRTEASVGAGRPQPAAPAGEAAA